MQPVSPTVASNPSPAEPPEPVRPTFSGSGSEYFRVWSVNVLLTVVTVGIYSAWGKVRREQYFHRSTRLGGAAFDWDASPRSILRGRLLAIGVFGLFQIATALYPLVAPIGSLVFAAAVPWLLTAALRFRLHHTLHRGIRFAFRGQAGEAARAYILWPVLSTVTLATLAPVAIQRQQRFVYGNVGFGTLPFTCDLPVRVVYGLCLATFALVVTLWGVLSGLILLAGGADAIAPGRPSGSLLMYGIALAGFAALWIAVGFYRVQLTNLTWEHLTLGPHRFRSDQTVSSYLALHVGNLLATLATLGLFRPWAAVRAARYRAEHLTMIPGASLDEIVAGTGLAPAAVGDELAEAFGIDIGF